MAATVPHESESALPPEGRDGEEGELNASSRKANSKPSWGAFLAIILLPALWMGYFAVRYSVDVPYYDQWTAEAPMFAKWETGRLGWADFMEQNNEHRLPIPRLVFFAFDLLTHWNTRAEIVLTLLVFLGMAVSLWKLFLATGWRAGRQFYVLFAAAALFVFDPLQDQNLSSGFQFHFVLPIALISAGFWAAMALRQPLNFVVTAALASFATFSMAMGLGAWFLIFPLLLLRERAPSRTKWILLWWGFFALNAGVFFAGYKLGLKHAPGGFHWAETGRYFATYLGTPFAWGTPFPKLEVAALAGAVLVLCAILAGVFVWTVRADRELLRRAAPWLMLMMIGMVGGALTTVGRSQYGAVQAMQTRYIPYAVTVPIGLLAIGALIWERSRGRSGVAAAGTRAGLTALAGAFLLLHFLSIPARFLAWTFGKHDRSMLKAVVTMVDFADPRMKGRVSPEPEQLAAMVHSMDRLGFLKPPVMKSRAISEIGDPSAKGETKFGVLEHADEQGGRIALSGWAILPDRLEPADAILITYDDPQGAPTILALVESFDERPDIVRLTGQTDLTYSGWRYLVSTASLPAGASHLKAWSYDAELGRAWRILGEFVARR